MLIRRFRLGDLPRILRIERVSFGRDSYSATTFFAHVCRDRKGLFVAEDEEGQVTGYALVRLGLSWLGRRRGGITSIAVDPAQRRQGIGRALVGRALEYLGENRVEEVDLEVNVQNRAARALYESFGFRDARLLQDYYGRNRDGVRMVMRLEGAGPVEGVGAGRASDARPGRGTERRRDA